MEASAWIAVISSAVAGLAAAVGGYLAAARRMSGQIRTTTAEQLWEESGALRRDMRIQIAQLTERVVVCTDENVRLVKENERLTEDHDRLVREVAALKVQIAEVVERNGHA